MYMMSEFAVGSQSAFHTCTGHAANNPEIRFCLFKLKDIVGLVAPMYRKATAFLRQPKGCGLLLAVI